MGSSSKDIMEILFNDKARAILYGLVHRSDPAGLALEDDDVFEPTISSILQLFADLMEGHTPDLYVWEWQTISEALAASSRGRYRLPPNIDAARNRLVLSVEDMFSEGEDSNSFDLSKKLAGLNNLEVCAIYWHVQKHLVAKSKNDFYAFPEIPFKG